MRSRLIPLLALVSLLATGFVAPVGTQNATQIPEATVVVEGDTGVVALHYESTALGRPTTTLVWLPDGYDERRDSWPAAYFLHGELPDGGSGRAHADNLDLGQLGAQRGFLLVVPDADAPAACATCVWVDGRGGRGIDAETHLHEEVIPLVENLFNVRPDRSGRAILGTSMGATGALIQGARHPDRFAFIGAMSPLLDLAGPPSGAGARYETYLVAQGLRPRGIGEIDHRNVSPLDLAPQLVWANVDTVITTVAEDRSTNAPAAALLAEAGLPHAYVLHEGERFTSDHDVFREHVLTPMQRVFDHGLPAPDAFSYKTADRSFSVWGYDVAVQRPNTEFLSVLGAQLDGAELILAGTGTATLTTPPAFEPGRAVPVVLTPDPHVDDPREPGQALAPLRPVELLVEADAEGRLTFDVELGATRSYDEDETLLENGQFAFPHVRIEVGEGSSTPADEPASNTPWLWHGCDASACDLPAPYDAWNVRVQPWATNPQVLTLDFDSPVLGLRARNYVHLPDTYFVEERPFPVLYFLHGTIDGEPPPSANYQSWNMRFHEPRLLERQRYVVVSVDMNDSSWCFKCWWIDHLDPPVGEIPWIRNFPLTEVPAETHLHQELFPLIEAMFRVRSDRGGRGVIGNSMGGGGAASQGFRHPDAFAFVGGVSGWQYDVSSSYNYHQGPETASLYFRRQGYPYREEGEIHYRNVSPSDLGSHLPGADVELVTTVGDGCVDFVDSSNHCGHKIDLLSLTETLARRDLEHVSPRYWTQVGVPHTVGSYAGTHFFPDGDVYESWYVDRINTTFATERVDPFRFSYKSTYPTFEAWGYDFVVERPNVEFLNVLGARLDGRSFALAGTGAVTVTTPATFVSNHRYRVVLTGPDGSVQELTVRAGKDRRLHVNVELGAPRESDERRALVEAGLFPFPITRVDIVGGPPVTPGPKP